MLVHVVSRFMLHPSLTEHYKDIEANGPDLVAFLEDQGLTDPADIAAILRFEEDPTELHDRVRSQIDAYFKRVINPNLKWPGGSLTLTELSPRQLDKGQQVTVEARGYWLGSDAGMLKLELHPSGAGASLTFIAQSVTHDPATKVSTAHFEVNVPAEDTFAVTLVRSLGGVKSQTSSMPNALVIS